MKKVVRDKIPGIIRKSGVKCRVKKLSDSRFLQELEKKLGEEIREYKKSKNVEEIVDIMEVIIAIAKLRGASQKKLEQIRLKKLKARGGFSKNLFLVSIAKKTCMDTENG